MNVRKLAICMCVASAALWWGTDQGQAQSGPTPGVDYTKPNYANSPPLRKFVDSLPQLGPTGTNNLGNYISVASKMTDPTGHGDDYYEIGLFDYTWKFHSDLPPTKVRGYRDLSPLADGSNHYLGPFIVAQRNKAVRLKFSNKLGVNGAGNSFLPVDTTVMGAGMGPYGMHPPVGPMDYSQNRADIHLHGGFTPWISDGTPHQWITPNGEVTSYTNGVSYQNVPDMANPGRGAATYYYPNQQSARLQFYHDHTYGMTRLNVYAGEVAGYLIQDPPATGEWTLPLPAAMLPLVVQDKTFVSDASTRTATNTALYTTAVDPLWNTAAWGAGGSLWFPHVYVPNQDPNSADGTNPFGRWDYGPWFWPPQTPGTIPGDLMYPNPPATSIVPEGFMDTPVVNGTAYPYVEVEPQAYRLRILNGCNDRTLNLSLFCAKSNGTMWNPATGALLDPNVGEVNMVPAVPTTGWPATWPTDGRDGGVPDPAASGPSFYQIGTEGGLLPQVAVIPPTPIGYEYMRRSITVLNVSTHGLLLMPAERADVIVDFSQFAGKTLILYNDGPAPVPAFDARLDYYTGDPDQTSSGGAPPTQPGYGPNTRTMMLIRVKAVPQPLGSIAVTAGGTGYTAPVVSITGGSPSVGATATAMVSSGAVAGVSILDDGVLYSAPVIHFTGGGGTGAAATATLDIYGGITGFVITNPGSGYTNAPAVTITDPTGVGFVGTTTITPAGVITGITLVTSGANYRGVPTVTITDPTGTNAVATAVLAGAALPAAYNLAALQAALPTAYLATQPPPIVPQLGYPGAYQGTSNTYARIYYNDLTFKPVGSSTNVTIGFIPKCIQELFDPYGRMNATLGVEIPRTTATTQTTLPYGYIDPPTEVISSGETQLWKITHNGVDSHAIHFHLVNVQVINRIGWDGTVKPPEANELGWKETVRMNPLEDVVVAMKAAVPASLPFAVPDSVRPLDPTMGIGSTAGFMGIDTNGQPVAVVNVMTNMGWEYVWHCHILGHEENDMMRPLIMRAQAGVPPQPVLPPAPTNLRSTLTQRTSVILAWNYTYTPNLGFVVQRSSNGGTSWTQVAQTAAGTTTFRVTGLTPATPYLFRVQAFNAAGASVWSSSLSLTTPP